MKILDKSSMFTFDRFRVTVIRRVSQENFSFPKIYQGTFFLNTKLIPMYDLKLKSSYANKKINTYLLLSTSHNM